MPDLDEAIIKEMETVVEEELPLQTRWQGLLKETRRSAVPILIIVAVLFVWQVVQTICRFPEYIIPKPSTIWATMVSQWWWLMENLLVTLLEAMGGFVLGNGIAIFLAVLFVYNRTIERAVYPFAITLRSIPIVAITPILVLMLGSDWQPKVAIAAIISFFPTLVNVIKGLEALEPSAFELMHVFNATTIQTFQKLRVPSAMPYLFAALKISVTSSMLGAIVAEWIGANRGLGYLLIIATFQFQTDVLWAAMLLAAATTTILFFAMGFIEGIAIPWRGKIEV
ncbi:MAG: ABC transporter permease [Chloroflexi bacterium]|nr:ABC transporter permease [Chloroflexota bacterium]